MAKTSVNNESKTRAIRQTSRDEFVKVLDNVRNIMSEETFENDICETTGNGLYKFTTTAPNDMTGVKKFEKSGLTWYKVPTSDYRLSFTSYLQYRLTADAKAKSALIKQLSELSNEELLALLAAKK